MPRPKPNPSPSHHPQNISKQIWYYEYRGKLEIIFNPKTGDFHHLKIPWKRLIESAKRCRPEEFVCHRQGNVAMLRKSKQGLTRLIESWEVVKIQRNKAWEAFGGVHPANESMPPDEKWGEQGWTFLTQEAAYQKYLELWV